MDLYSGYINKLIDELSGLPGIGSKSAQRLAFHLIGLPEAKVNRIANAMIQARQNVRYCKECFTLTDNELCPICANAERDHSTIMVVENSRDLAAYEKTGKYKGVYHVLHGAISPMLGVGPHDIKLKELMERLSREPEVKEVIIAKFSDERDGRTYEKRVIRGSKRQRGVFVYTGKQSWYEGDGQQLRCADHPHLGAGS